MEDVPPQPLPLLPLSVRFAHGESRQRQQPLCSLSEGCVLFHINDKDGRGTKKSLSYTHLFKKRQNLTIQSAGVRRNSVKAGGAVGVVVVVVPMTKGRNSLTFFVPKTRGRPRKFQTAAGLHRNRGILHAFQWVCSCIKKGAVTAQSSSSPSPVVESLQSAQTMGVVPPLG